MESNRRPLARGEKPLLGWSSGICALLLGAGWVYEHNNRVPWLQIPQAAPPAVNAFDFYRQAGRAYVAPTGAAVDAHLDARPDDSGHQLALFTPAYRARYPLDRQRAFLARNAPALRVLRAGLALPYLQPPERDGKGALRTERTRDLARVLLVESHVRAQTGDWDGAADSLLDVYRMGAQTPRGGGLAAFGRGNITRRDAEGELWLILPHLSAAKARASARCLEEAHQQISRAQALEEEKRAGQSAILTLIRSRDWRPVYLTLGCVSGCAITAPPEPRQWISDLNAVPMSFRLRADWMDKSRFLSEYTRCMNWQIAQTRKPFPTRTAKWPFPKSDDAVEQMLYPDHIGGIVWSDLQQARDQMLVTALALHAYHLDKGKLPQNLAQLVPDYLERVPLDPLSDRRPLLYAPVPVRYVSALTLAPASVSSGPGPSLQRAVYLKSYAQTPFKLWSRGLNARDNGGVPCQKQNARDARDFYPIGGSDASCDIVAGISR